MRFLKFQSNCLPLFLTAHARNLFCVENGGLKGFEVKPDPDDPDYPVNWEKSSWNIKDVSIEEQILVCETLRVKNKGEGRSLLDDGSACWCTVYEVITFKPENNFTIRGIDCNSSVSNKTLAPMSGLRLTILYPSFSPTSNPSFGSRSTSTRAVNESLTPTPTPTLPPKVLKKKNLSLIIILCTVIPVLLFCVWFLGRRYIVKRRIKRKSISFSKTTNSKRVTVENKRISIQSSPVSSSHYLNPITKRSTVPSEREYFSLDNDPSR